jgi:hypothetical protein
VNFSFPWQAARKAFEVALTGAAPADGDRCTLRRVLAHFEYRHTVAYSDEKTAAVGLGRLWLEATTADTARFQVGGPAWMMRYVLRPACGTRPLVAHYTDLVQRGL